MSKCRMRLESGKPTKVGEPITELPRPTSTSMCFSRQAGLNAFHVQYNLVPLLTFLLHIFLATHEMCF